MKPDWTITEKSGRFISERSDFLLKICELTDISIDNVRFSGYIRNVPKEGTKGVL